MRARFVPLFSIALAALFACGGGSTRPACDPSRVDLDGVCVAPRVADYVSCVRAQGASLDALSHRALSANAGQAAAHAATAVDVSDALSRKYSASDGNVREVIRACNALVGLSPVDPASYEGTWSWSCCSSAFNGTLQIVQTGTTLTGSVKDTQTATADALTGSVTEGGIEFTRPAYGQHWVVRGSSSKLAGTITDATHQADVTLWR